MESQLSFAQKISKKSLKFAKIAKNEIWTKSGKNPQFWENFQIFRFFDFLPSKWPNFIFGYSREF